MIHILFFFHINSDVTAHIIGVQLVKNDGFIVVGHVDNGVRQECDAETGTAGAVGGGELI